MLTRKGSTSQEADLVGVVIRADRFSAAFTRILLQVDGLYVWAVCRTGLPLDLPRVTRGALVRIAGRWRMFRGHYEVEVRAINSVSQAAFWPGGRSGRSFELLGLRSLVIQEMHAMFREWGYVPVDSPSIVSDWALGDTQPLEVQFYDRKAFLSISNMLYHQMLASNGFNRFYEIGKLFRKETPSTTRKLAEFTIVDISQVGVGIDAIMSDFEELILRSVSVLERQSNLVPIVDDIEFDTVSWDQLVAHAGGGGGKGAQLNAKCRQFLEDNYRSFVWVVGFPVEKRPFYTKASNGVSHDCQLWYRGRNYLVAGSEVETDPDLLEKRIESKNSKAERYAEFLDVASAGMPLMSMAGMGIERFLSMVIQGTVAADHVVQPRYQNGRIF